MYASLCLHIRYPGAKTKMPAAFQCQQLYEDTRFRFTSHRQAHEEVNVLRETRLHRNKTTCACTSSTTQILHLFSVHSWTTPGNGWLTWFSQSLVLTQPSVCVVILIASAQRGETLCPAPLHYAALHCVPLPHGCRLMCYQNDDACQKYWPKLHNKLLQQCVSQCVCLCAGVHCSEASEMLTGITAQERGVRFVDLSTPRRKMNRKDRAVKAII